MTGNVKHAAVPRSDVRSLRRAKPPCPSNQPRGMAGVRVLNEVHSL